MTSKNKADNNLTRPLSHSPGIASLPGLAAYATKIVASSQEDSTVGLASHAEKMMGLVGAYVSATATKTASVSARLSARDGHAKSSYLARRAALMAATYGHLFVQLGDSAWRGARQRRRSKQRRDRSTRNGRRGSRSIERSTKIMRTAFWSSARKIGNSSALANS